MVVDENQALNPQYTKDGVHPTSEDRYYGTVD